MVNSTPALDRSFHALAHPVRRAIVERLARGSATVGEATRGLAVSKPAVTKHLRTLEEAGLVSRAVAGRTHRLTLRDEPLDDALGWVARQRRLWEAKFDVVEAHLAAQDAAAEERRPGSAAGPA